MQESSAPKSLEDLTPDSLAALIRSKVQVVVTETVGGGGGEEEGEGAGKKTAKAKLGKGGKSNLKMLLLGNKDFFVAGYGPALIEHCLLKAGLTPTGKLKGK